MATDSSTSERQPERRRSRRRIWVASVAAVFALAALVVPSLLRPLAASAIRDAVRAEVPESAEVSVSVSLGWTAPLGATVDVRDGAEVQASLEIATDRGLLSWLGPVFGGSIGEVPISFALVARLEGAAGRAMLDRLRDERSRSASEAPTATGSGEPRDASGIPEGLSIAADGSIDLAIIDAERGIDLAIDSEQVELILLADRTVEAAVMLRIGRVAEAAALPGRFTLEGSLSRALAADGSISWSQAEGAVSIESSSLGFEWEGRDVSIESLRASVAASAADGLSLGARLAGAIDGAVAQGEADLAWRSPFAEDGSLRGDLAGLGGVATITGMPTAAVASFVPSPYDEFLRDLGSSLDAEIAVPTEAAAAVVARIAMERLQVDANGRLDRVTGLLADGAATISADPSMRALIAAGGLAIDEGSSLESRIPIAFSIEGLELLESNDLRIASGGGSIGAGGVLVRALLPQASLSGGDSIGLELSSLRWRISDGVAALEARGKVEVDGVLSLETAADRPALPIADLDVEWFAEPLGKALSLRARAASEGAIVRFEERFDGLWTGRGWVPVADLRPHGNLSLEGVAAGRVAPWIPEPYRAAWSAQDLDAISVQLGTRVEGDRLEGVMQIAGKGLSMRAPISLDSQRLAVGSASVDATLRPEAIDLLPEAIRGEWRLFEPASVAVAVEPIVFAVTSLGRGEFDLPPISASIASPAIVFGSLDSDERIAVSEVRLAMRQVKDGSIDADASLTVPPFSRGLGEGQERVVETTRPFVASLKAQGLAAPASAAGFGGLVLEWSPIEMSLAVGASKVSSVVAAHRASIQPQGDGERFAISLRPIASVDSAASLRFEGALVRGQESAWVIDGEGSANDLPAAIATVFASDDGLVGRALGETLDATIRAVALSGDSGEVALSLEGARGRLDLPRLLVEPEVLRIPLEPAFSGQFAFSPGLLTSLEDLNPMLGQLESMEQPIRIRMWECSIPRAGVGPDRLNGRMRVDFGRGRFVPDGVLERILVTFGDAAADGFDGFADPLIATIRQGQVSYENFAVRFVPYQDGWRNTLTFAGRIDLVRSPAFGEFTAAYPASSLAAYSAEIRKVPPDVLAALTVPMTLYGPLDGSDLKLRIDFDFGKLIEEGVKAGVREGARRLFEDLLGPKQ